MSLKKKEILIVDDDPEMRQLLRRILENIGIAVSEADSVNLAMKMYAERCPHLIISDVDMKPESGLVLMQLLRGKGEKLPVPVIILSGVEDKKSVHFALATGVTDYLAKPLNASLLIQKVRKNLHVDKFNSYALAENERFEVPSTFPARITAASEAGFRLVASVRLDPGTTVSADSTYLKELEIQDYPFRAGPRLAKSVEGGQYNNEILLPGVTRDISARIRKVIMKWK